MVFIPSCRSALVLPCRPIQSPDPTTPATRLLLAHHLVVVDMILVAIRVVTTIAAPTIAPIIATTATTLHVVVTIDLIEAVILVATMIGAMITTVEVVTLAGIEMMVIVS